MAQEEEDVVEVEEDLVETRTAEVEEQDRMAGKWEREEAATRVYDSWEWLEGARATLDAPGSAFCSSEPFGGKEGTKYHA